MTPADLTRTVVRAVRCAVEDGELPARAAVPARVVVERTRPGGVGEYATPVAFQVAKAAGRPPGEVARVLAGRLGAEAGIARVEVTGAGFLNFVLEERSSVDVVRDALRLVGDFPGPGPGPGPGTGPVQLASAGELRARVVGRAVGLILLTQGIRDAGPPPKVAPVARRDGDVVARFGGDAAVWAMLSVPAHETPSFSGSLLVQDESSEFFRVRYAHACAVGLVRNARLLGFGPELVPVPPGDGAPLVRALADHPLVLEAAAHHRAPERLVRHLVELADALLDFQYRVLPKGDEKPSAAHRARLALAEAAGTVLAGGLALLGIPAPDCL
ncbi:ArgS-related anticodon-binding protein NrtL [Streptomyces sp. HUAS TT3]|uniref:ArgS-related anticodon-binding protein NrtL n=1 Tax=Streptomyces sp. HUAS TT3 TaxID=3447510 RepID=UPI003F66043A